MQAKVIKTGEVVEVYKTTTGWVSETLNRIRFFEGTELDFDCCEWEIFRREAAKDILPAIIGKKSSMCSYGEVVEEAITFADELIKQLKEENK